MLGQLADVDLRLIRVFQAVVQAGGVSAAQSTLNVNQSTISTQLASLESRLGYRLCERGRSGFMLTPKGQQFFQLSAQLLSSIDEFCLEARSLEHTLVGQLRIGLIGHTATHHNTFLSSTIARFKAREENVELVFSILEPGSLEESVLNGKIDLGIAYCWHTVPSLNYHFLFNEQQLAYCSSQHPLFNLQDEILLQTVQNHDWVWRTYPLPDLGFSIENWRVTARADNMEAVAILILSGHYLGFLPVHFAQPMVDQGLLKPLNPQVLQYQVALQMVYQHQKAEHEVLAAFLADMQEVFKHIRVS